MGNTFFLGDTHLNHAKVLTFEAKRNVFTDVAAHDAYVIAQINKYVRPKDVLWLLGDIYFGKPDDYFTYLMMSINCVDKRLIPGNHDEMPMHEYERFFSTIAAYRKKYGFVMAHVPLHPDCLEERWGRQVHGHFHSRAVMRYNVDKGIKEPDPRYLCVSAESHPSGEFARPWSLNEVREYFNE